MVLCATYMVLQSALTSILFDIKCLKAGKYDKQLLPPNQDSLDQHIRQANYQCHIWRHTAQPVLNLSSFREHGWKVDEDGNVLVNWLTIAPAPESLLKLVNCKCRKGCENNRCSCVKAGLNCSQLCKCLGCKNNNGDNIECDSDTYDPQDDYGSSNNSDNEY